MPQDNRLPQRKVRTSDDLWERAMRAVTYRGDQSVSHIIRGFLTQYVEETEKMMARKGRTHRGANHDAQPRPRGRGSP